MDKDKIIIGREIQHNSGKMFSQTSFGFIPSSVYKMVDNNYEFIKQKYVRLKLMNTQFLSFCYCLFNFRLNICCFLSFFL